MIRGPERFRFVILHHDWPAAHWDLLLEVDLEGPLATWRLWRRPEPGTETPAERIADHRRRYLDYEGPVSGGRGSVRRWDEGVWERLDEAPGRLTLWFLGRKISGQVDIIEGSGATTIVFHGSESGSAPVR